MDLFEESRDERLIEDYLFSGYKPTNQKSTFDADQQFARPIEDEDLFCVKDHAGALGSDSSNKIDNVAPEEVVELEPSANQSDFEERPFRRLSDEPLSEANANSPGKLFEDEASDPLTPPRDEQDEVVPEAPIDDIFLDDYSDSGDNNENIRPRLVKSYSKPPQLTPAQVKKKLVRERLKQQAIAMQLTKPKGAIGSDFGSDGTIELSLDHSKLVSDSSSKFIFNKLFNKSNKATDSKESTECDKKDWSSIKVMLLKRISAQKRKVWDSFQAPADAYNEEEEFIGGESIGGSEKDAEETQENSNEADGDDDIMDNARNDDAPEESSSKSSSGDEADIEDSDLDDLEDDASAEEADNSKMDCDEESSEASDIESDDEIVRRKIIDDEESNVNDDGSMREFIDDEVSVDEDL